MYEKVLRLAHRKYYFNSSPSYTDINYVKLCVVNLPQVEAEFSIEFELGLVAIFLQPLVHCLFMPVSGGKLDYWLQENHCWSSWPGPGGCK